MLQVTYCNPELNVTCWSAALHATLWSPDLHITFLGLDLHVTYRSPDLHIDSLGPDLHLQESRFSHYLPVQSYSSLTEDQCCILESYLTRYLLGLHTAVQSYMLEPIFYATYCSPD